jgi:hypothetical protein
MTILTIVLGAFALIETLNVIVLYARPDSTIGNAVGVFRAYSKTQGDPVTREFVNYLINWVAGTKLIFIALIIAIILTAPPETAVFSVVALVVTIPSFYLRLFPILRRIDARDELEPQGYSRTLALMIGGFITAFVVALGVYLVI